MLGQIWLIVDNCQFVRSFTRDDSVLVGHMVLLISFPGEESHHGPESHLSTDVDASDHDECISLDL